LIHVPSGPRLSEVKVRVSPDAVTGEVSMCKKATLSVKRRAVAVEAFRKGQHDVGILVDLPSDVAEGDLSEGERDNALPHFEGLSDGIISGSFTHFGGVVLYAAADNGKSNQENADLCMCHKSKYIKKEKQ